MRRIAVWLIALLLAGNGIAGIVAAWIGWQTTTNLLATLRQTTATAAEQQARLVESVNGVAVGVDDASQATRGVSQSTARARAALTQATQTSANLAATFDRLSEASQITVFGARPLAPMAESFSANAEDFRGLSGSLTETAASLDANARDMLRVSDDLQGVSRQVRTSATQIEALQVPALLDQGLTTMEMGSRLLLMMIFFESLLSALLGLALFMLTGLNPAPPHIRTPVVLAESPDRSRMVVEAPRP